MKGREGGMLSTLNYIIPSKYIYMYVCMHVCMYVCRPGANESPLGSSRFLLVVSSKDFDFNKPYP